MPRADRFVLVTGLSGAGKSRTLEVFEDLGYKCVDNLPAALVPTFAQLVLGQAAPRSRYAVCVDARAGSDLQHLPRYLDMASEAGITAEVLFLDSSDEVLLHRYQESRRPHPCSPAGSVEQGIREERRLLEAIRDRADKVVDTSHLSVAELRDIISATFASARTRAGLVITVLTFGFKHGIPPESDLVFDVRFLPNPHYDEELRPLTGIDTDVRDYVLRNETAEAFLKHLKSFLKFVVPQYEREKKSYLTVAIGCTGGRHRSVAIAHEVAMLLRDLKYDARIRHRDIGEPA